MADVLSPALVNGVGVIGVFVWLLYMLATGRLVTRREADAITARAEAAERSKDAADRRADVAMAQNSELIEVARFGRSVFQALDEGAKSP